MPKKNKESYKKYSKYFDTNIAWQAVFGAASIICAIMVCFFDHSLATVFDVMKDVFGTLMVFVVFFVAIHHFRERFATKRDKIDYMDFWDDNKADIFGDDILSFQKPLVYGILAATYSIEETKALYDHIEEFLQERPHLSHSKTCVLKMVKGILLLFIETNRLNKPIYDKAVFDEIIDILSYPCENDIEDTELAAWCRIIRNDKMELAHECYAAGLEGRLKESYLSLALTTIKDCIRLIESQVQKNPDDKNFASLYLAYLSRNIAQIHRELYKLNNNPKDLEEANKYIIITYDIRKELYDYFTKERKTKTITYDYVTQEYVLSLTEKYHLETNKKEKQNIEAEIHTHYDNWILKSKTRDMLLKRITDEMKKEGLKKGKVALLCDYGMDDAVATLHLLKYADRFEQIDILPVGGNFPLDEVTVNAKRILTHMENLPKNVRLVDTSSVAQHSERLTDIHGEDGIGRFIPANHDYSGKIMTFDEWLKEVDESYDIVSLGPCTVTKEILAKCKINSLIIMAGNIAEPPNYNEYEFNHGLDPEAFSECVKYPHVAVTLDTVHDEYCDFNLIDVTGEATFIKAVERAKSLSNIRKEPACYIYDLAAVVYLLEPQKFTSEIKVDPFGNEVNVLKYIDNNFIV